jgi:GDP/UDP-N,N'-diacetylbacillosamine 2-epimerase (hydrolysing)
MGTMIRQYLTEYAQSHPEKCHLVEVLGTVGYYSCMKHCDYLLGNTSSGIIEAASFNKYVINLGDRQKGRDSGGNVLHVKVDHEAILDAADKIENMPPFEGDNIYGNGTATGKIIKALKQFDDGNK